MIKQLSYPQLSKQDLCPDVPNLAHRRQTLPHRAQNIHIELDHRRIKDVGGWISNSNSSSGKKKIKKENEVTVCHFLNANDR